ncbi:MAG: apolipoprotein N-acyltransferase [Campylobacteraceae bacterium]
MLKNFPQPYKSFNKKNLTKYSSTSKIIKAFFIALFLSAFIYLDYFGVTNFALHVSAVFVGFYLLFNSEKLTWFFSGFFIGLFWFYWMGLSFRFYELTWMIPFVILGVGLIFGILFLVPSLISKSPFIRVGALLLLSQIAPFGFNWFHFELPFMYTPFGLTPLHVASFMLGVLLIQNLKGAKKYLCIIFFILSIDFSIKNEIAPFPLDLEIIQTDVSQKTKWDKAFITSTVNENLKEIEKAIENNKKVIVFPETAFPLYLNTNEEIINILKIYSQKIAIITGSLAHEGEKYLNSAYFFDKGEMKRADKVVLVPFGEEVPLPNFLAKPINRIFFGVENDFTSAKEPVDFKIDDVVFRTAICYEGSAKELHVNAPKYMFVLSNNAWFLPSTEPTLQNLMLKLYATKSDTLIYHVVNGEGGGVITPRKSLVNELYLRVRGN